MPAIKSQKGFTLPEILVAILIIGVGSLALTEMEALSVRQKQRAETGTIATNIIQFVSDRDMAEVRRRYLLNATAYLDAQTGRNPDFSYCNGSATSACDDCPCDPLQALTPNPVNGADASMCEAIDVHDFDPGKLDFKDNKDGCQGGGNADLFIVKNVRTNQAAHPASGQTVLTVSITYAVKTPSQFENTDLESVSIKDSLASQTYQVTAHIDSYANFITDPGWDTVRIPHIP